jgi:hypothetical protein
MSRTQSNSVGAFLDNVPTPGPVKDWLGYKKEYDQAGRPRYTFDGARFTLLFRSWMFSRAISTSDRQFRDNMEKGGVQWQRMALDVLTGIRRKDVDMNEQMRRKLNERIRDLEDVNVRRGGGKRFEKFFVPKQPGQLR